LLLDAKGQPGITPISSSFSLSDFYAVALIAFHQVAQNIGTGGTIFSVQVASLTVSNYALERMDGTNG